MAYVGNRPLPGLMPVNNTAGTSPRVRMYDVSATYATNIGEGNVLVKSSIGLILAPTAAITNSGIVVGVAASNNLAYVAGGTSHQSKMLVYDDPDQEYMVIPDGVASAALQIDMVGQFAPMLTNVYNTTLGQGNTKADISVTSTFVTTHVQFQVVSVGDNVGDTIATTQAGNVGQIRVRLPHAHNIVESYSGTRA